MLETSVSNIGEKSQNYHTFTILVSGVGHIYLGIIKRGIIILVVGIALWIIVPLFVPFPFSWVFTGAYWIWQIVDVYWIYKKMDSGQTQITDFKR